MGKFTRYFGCVFKNAFPQENVEGGMVEVGISGVRSGDGGLVEGSWVIDTGGVRWSKIVRSRTRGSDRRKGHGGGRGGRGGHGWGSCVHRGCCGHRIPNNRINVGNLKQPALYLLWDKCSDLFTLYQIADAVCPSTSATTGDQSPNEKSPDKYDDGKLQGTIQFSPPQNVNNHGAISK